MFVYLGREDGIFKVKDTDDGKVDFLTNKELRQAIVAVGKIDGISIDTWGNIIDSKGIILDAAPVVVNYNTRKGNLAKAKSTKNDEYYTQITDISKEMVHYPAGFFEDKTIYCPTDVSVNTGKTKQSQFVRYFQTHAHKLRFKRLIATCLVEHATAVGESEDDVKNCYILERSIVPENRRYTLIESNDGSGQVVKKVVDEFIDPVDGTLKYLLEDSSSVNVPLHVVRQAVQDAYGAVDIVRRYIDHYDASSRTDSVRIIPGTEDKGCVWEYAGHQIHQIWCWVMPRGTVIVLSEDCYVFSESLNYGDWCPFMTDANGNPLVEEVDGGYVGLRAPAYYNYIESDYEDYEYHCPADIDFETGEVIFESGDFRSAYCSSILKQADIVCTNPPFSLFREFMSWLLPAKKNILVIGNMNAITYKEIWPYIQRNELWLGHHPLGTPMYFDVPASHESKLINGKKEGRGYKGFKKDDGTEAIRARVAACWFSSMDSDSRHEPLTLTRRYVDDPDIYPKYDNYDAINIDKITDIPYNYSGVMGVPITFIQKYCPEQFEIVDISPHFFAIVASGGVKPKQLTLNSVGRKDPYARVLIRKRS